MKFLIVFIFAVSGSVFAASPVRCPTICTLESNPQCGVGFHNRKFEWATYGNPCALGIWNCNNPNRIRYALKGVGECKNILPSASSDSVRPQCAIACTADFRPVCGVGFYNRRFNWQTHSNACALDVYNCKNPKRKQNQIKNVGDCKQIFPTSNSSNQSPSPFPFPFPLPLPLPCPSLDF